MTYRQTDDNLYQGLVQHSCSTSKTNRKKEVMQAQQKTIFAKGAPGAIFSTFLNTFFLVTIHNSHNMTHKSQ